MWQLIWDTIGYIMDSVPRWAKLTIFGLFVGVVYLFFGYRVTLYVVGGLLWAVFIFLVGAHIVVFLRNQKKERETAPAPLTPADQADIQEFQEAMEQAPAQAGFETPPTTPTDETPTQLPPQPQQ